MENFEEQDDTLSISENLDENGFPLSEENNGDFSSDFYGSGTDWSSLVLDSNKKLKQSNLFQMWGIKKKKPEESISSSLKQTNLFQMWGIKKKPEKSNSGKNETLIKDSRMKRKGNQSNQQQRRVCPFYKKIPGTPFSVDAFRYGLIEGCSAYFLSHFHYDHYGGLSKGWSHGPIYCTPLTARLAKMCLSVNPSFICPLELDVEHNIKGVKVTMLEANHCPGAALIHFRLMDGRCYLHTGDFRASKSMQSYSLLANHRINLLYLDTTYCNPKYRFPSKEDVLAFVVKIAKQSLKKQPKTLIVVGAYSIGKECVYLAISEALQVKIHTNASRRRILQSFGWPELSEKLSSDGHDTPLHVLPLSTLRHENLKKYMETYGSSYTTVLAFRPTGWTYSETAGNQLDLIRPNCKGNITIYGVPYSEHSSFLEMREFVQFLKPDKIIPTVNVGNASNRDKMQSYFREWMK
ncbi:snm1-like protein [Ranunculus cassubicifolius]